jgi:hypothetical protein
VAHPGYIALASAIFTPPRRRPPGAQARR